MVTGSLPLRDHQEGVSILPLLARGETWNVNAKPSADSYSEEDAACRRDEALHRGFKDGAAAGRASAEAEGPTHSQARGAQG
jgi:hypothetical protein